MIAEETNGIISSMADDAARKYFESYNKLGELIGRSYMTAITVQDTYGEAKEAGASDLEATLLTLGYGAAENALLKTDIGRWIMPELKANSQKMKIIGKKLMELPQGVREQGQVLAGASQDVKKNWFKKMFNLGKEAFEQNYSSGKRGIAAMIGAGLGEGLEEVSEEALLISQKVVLMQCNYFKVITLGCKHLVLMKIP